MKRTKTIIAITCVFVLLFSYENLLGNTDLSVRSYSDLLSPQTVPTKTKSAQTTPQTVPTKTKSAQTTPKTVQTKPKSPQTTTKTVQTKPKPAKTGTKTVQTKPGTAKTGSKSTQPKPKTTVKNSPSELAEKDKAAGIIRIGTQAWAIANLDVNTFRNGDTIPEAKTNAEWVAAGEAGKPAWCYYNNDPATGKKYGRLYNWYAVNDQRELAPEGWSLASDEDWSALAYSLGGPDAAGGKLKSTFGWIDGNNGSNESGFNGMPGGYRIENGLFKNSGGIGTWWSTTEGKSASAVDFYMAQSSNSLGRSSNSKQRGESVRCLRK